MTDVRDILQDALTRCVDDIKRRHVNAGQKATGRTMDALEVRVRAEGAAIIGEIWGMPYTGEWETGVPSSPRLWKPRRGCWRNGCRKGTDAERQAMVRNLKEWAAIRGLTAGMTDRQAENLARYLAWYINRYGSRLWRNGGRRDIITPAVEATERVLEERLSQYYETQMDNMFFNSTR